MSDDPTIDERPSGLPLFTMRGVVFECRTIGTGGAARFVWRSTGDYERRLSAGKRIVDSTRKDSDGRTVPCMAAVWWSRCDDALIGADFATAAEAMSAAVAEMRIIGRAAA